MIPEDWQTNPPDDLETITEILDAHEDEITSSSQIGDTLRSLLRTARSKFDQAVQSTRLQNPQAFIKPSYEQCLLLNAWVWGINFPICYSANRIGKTFAFVFNAVLWLFPNNPQWRCFKPYIDKQGRMCYVLPRPTLGNLLQLQQHYLTNPHLVGDPYQQPYEGENRNKWIATLQILNPLLDPCWPYPPILRGTVIWLGAPDNEFHKSIIMPRWRDILPKSSILKDSETDRQFIISTASQANPKTTVHRIICKSYESEDTKWSGDAVDGIILTEGFDQATLNEIKNRVTNEAFASWDYTPAEARNTGKKVSLAYKVYKREEQLPLRPFIFTRFSVRNAPDHIIPKEKRDDLIRMWDGTEEGKARLDGEFFASSGLILDSLKREFHCLDWSLNQLQEEYPGGQFYRGLDPGFDHPTACCWGYLAPNNIWFIYRFYSKRNTTISQRCNDIITFSHNERERFVRKGQVFYREVHTNPDSEIYVATVADYHTFKTDETTGTNYSNQYINEGLVLTESTHMGPEERATKANSLLDPNGHRYLAHPRSKVPPGARVFFLTSQPGVAEALDKFDQLFWDRYKAGDLRGEPKDKVPIHGDDELDAMCSLICGPYVWTSYKPRRIEPTELETLQKRNFQNENRIATLQSIPQVAGHFS